MKNCGNCKNWLNPIESDHEAKNVPAWPDINFDYKQFHGRCLAALEYDGNAEDSKDYDTEELSYCYKPELVKKQKESPMLAVDGSGYFAGLFTLESHFCSSWESK